MSRSHFAYRARHGMRSHAWRSVISRDASLAEDLFARGGRCAARASGLAGLATEPKQNVEHARRIYHGVAARCALHSQHRKSVWEVVQAFGRVVSAESYNFDRPTAFVGKVPVASGLQRLLQEILLISEIDRPIFRVNPSI